MTIENMEYRDKTDQKLLKYLIKHKHWELFRDFFTGNINNVADDATKQRDGK